MKLNFRLIYKKEVQLFLIKASLFLGVFLFSISSPALASSFKHQDFYRRHSFNLFFNSAGISQINKVSITLLKENLRPKIWPKRIPFAAGIDQIQNRAFFGRYTPILLGKIYPIIHEEFEQLEDIEILSTGKIFITDSKANKVFVFQISNDIKSVNLIKTVDIIHPTRIESDSKENVFILTKTNELIKMNSNTFKVNPKISSKITTQLRTHSPIDLTISKDHKIHILTKNGILKFNRNGRLIKKINHNLNYTSISDSAYGDLFLLNPSLNMIDKYNKQLEKLDYLDLSPHFEYLTQDIDIYYPFGYVGIISPYTGVYFGLQADISDIHLKTHKKSDGELYYKINFLVKFISNITLEIKDSKGNIIRTLLNKTKLSTDQYQIFWDGKDQNNNPCKGNYTISITAKGLYSVIDLHQYSYSFSL